MILAKIVSAGSAFPEGKLTNKELSHKFDKPEDYFFEKTGIKERTITADNESTNTLSVKAAKAALLSGSMDPKSIDLVIVGTTTSTYLMPSEACVIQRELKLTNAVAFDVAAACAGWMFALQTAIHYLNSPKINRALVIGADTLSKVRDPNDRPTSMLFGDGAGATIIDKIDTSKTPLTDDMRRVILDVNVRTKGEFTDLFYIPYGGSFRPITKENCENPKRYMVMRGMEVFRHSVMNMTEECRDTLKRNNLTAKDIALFIPHQANINIAKHVAEKLEMDKSKILENIESHGNVSSACLPSAIDKTIRENRAKDGDLVLVSAFGAGFAAGSALIKW